MSGKEKAVEKLLWFSGESPEGRPYWETADAAWAKDFSRFRLTEKGPGEDVGTTSTCRGDWSDRRTASASPWSKIMRSSITMQARSRRHLTAFLRNSLPVCEEKGFSSSLLFLGEVFVKIDCAVFTEVCPSLRHDPCFDFFVCCPHEKWSRPRS